LTAPLIVPVKSRDLTCVFWAKNRKRNCNGNKRKDKRVADFVWNIEHEEAAAGGRSECWNR